jgi:hypothetical protein
VNRRSNQPAAALPDRGLQPQRSLNLIYFRFSTDAGDHGVTDDPGWGEDTLLTSQYSALLLANPFLQYIDVTNTRLTNNGIFYLILELAYSDPSQSPCGHKHLKQCCIGPPCQPAIREAGHEAYAQTALEALEELFLQCPAFQLVCLMHPPGTCGAAAGQTHERVSGLWKGLDGKNSANEALYLGESCSVLRTRWGHVHCQLPGWLLL